MTDWPPEFGPLEICEYKIIKAHLDLFDGNLTNTADALRLSFRCIQYKVRRYAKLGLPIQWRHRADTIKTLCDDDATKTPARR
jgi:hypothetical protein